MEISFLHDKFREWQRMKKKKKKKTEQEHCRIERVEQGNKIAIMINIKHQICCFGSL